MALLAAVALMACDSSDATVEDSATDAPVDSGGDGSVPCATSELSTGDAADAWGVALDDAFVYWTEKRTGGRIARMPLSGGAVETVADGQAEPARLAVFDGNVYWTNAGDGTIGVAPVNGAEAPTMIASDQMRPGRISVDETGVYWTDEDAGTVMHVGLDGSALATIADGQGLPSGIALGDGVVVWAAAGATGAAIHRAALDGSEAMILATDPGWAPQDVAVRDGFVYWADAGSRAVMRIPVSGGEPELIAEHLVTPRGIAVDDARVAWTSFDDRGAVGVASLDGASLCIIEGQRLPFGIASNGVELVWARTRSGEIARAVFSE